MTEDELADLLDLYIDNALPESLRATVETYLAAHPQRAAETAALQATVQKLQTAPRDRPDAWFVERALDRLLQEHHGAQETDLSASDREGLKTPRWA